jgi:hypothetical protein
VAYTTTTLSELKALLDQRIDASSFWTPDEARLAFNEGLREWNLWTGRWRRRVSLDTAVGQHEYSLPSTLTYGMAVKYLGSALHPTSYTDLDLGRPNWRQETAGSGGDVPESPVVWAPQSLQQIVLWPAPSAVVVNGITVDGVSDTPILVEDADTVDIGEELIDLLTDYALHVLAFKEGGPRWMATVSYYQAFLQAAAEENGRLKANQVFRRTAGLDYRRGQIPSKGRPTRMDTLPESVEA